MSSLRPFCLNWLCINLADFSRKLKWNSQANLFASSWVEPSKSWMNATCTYSKNETCFWAAIFKHTYRHITSHWWISCFQRSRQFSAKSSATGAPRVTGIISVSLHVFDCIIEASKLVFPCLYFLPLQYRATTETAHARGNFTFFLSEFKIWISNYLAFE